MSSDTKDQAKVSQFAAFCDHGEMPYAVLREAIIKLTALTDRQRYMASKRDV